MLSAIELSERFEVTRQTVYNWVERGVPYYKTPKGVKMVLRFDLDEVEAWIEKQRGGVE